ncbi:phage tail-collar fiber domain-containing protein [Aeromonas caviae]|uniref:phage tail-collar fiber domain-containing protein n=1 Tax=Aeromonas caviae TaxID=648 RepID=UPI002DD657E8|nr:phage tail protein [Aeromonas caviae]
MSQVITNAFEQYWQSSLAAEQPVVLDEFILADIPNLDINSPIDPDTGLPPESQIVHRQNVDQRGRINNNAVAYTIVMDTTVGDFSFNAMYLRNKQNGVIGMIVYKGRETKLKTDQTTGQTGNSLVKSMLMGYDQAAEATLTNVDAGTWQIDYAARLRGMDEDIRQLQADLYGHHTFVGDGFKVVETDGAFQVTPGVAIVGGLRVELKQPEVIYPGTTPIGVWVDVHRSGSLLSEHQNHFTLITSVTDLTDHVDGSGYQHFVAKLGSVQADSTVIDDRGQVSSSGSGAIPDTFALWKRSMAEASYDLIGQFGNTITIEKADQVVLSKDGTKVFAWNGALPKHLGKDDIQEEQGSDWKIVSNDFLRRDLTQFEDELKAKPKWSAVLLHKNRELSGLIDIQVKALTERTELLKIGMDSISTEEAMQMDLTGVTRFSTVSFYSGWSTTIKVSGGATWVSTGEKSEEYRSVVRDHFLYDLVGNEFGLKKGTVTPQQLGAKIGEDCSSHLKSCMNFRKVLIEDDIVVMNSIGVINDKTTINLDGSTVTCSMNNADESVFLLNNKKRFKVKNGVIRFISSGKFLYGNVKRVDVDQIDFIGGTISLQFKGEFGDECTDIYIGRCTHDGTTPTMGTGGFVSIDAGKRIYISDCSGKNGAEFIDLNNLCSHVWITNCLSENYYENHLDINSSWHVKVSFYTLISTVSGLRGRPVWVSDHTMGNRWPVGAPERLKNSNYVSFEGCNFRINNFDYTEFFLVNVGTEYNPLISEGRKLIMSLLSSVFDNDTGVMDSDKIKLGIYSDLIDWDIKDNKFKSVSIKTVGAGKLTGNIFDAEREGYVGRALDVSMIKGDVSSNTFYGWTGTQESSLEGGVILSRNCRKTTFSMNKFKSDTACHAVISSREGGTNEYIDNRFDMSVSAAKGIRSNTGDIVIYSVQ